MRAEPNLIAPPEMDAPFDCFIVNQCESTDNTSFRVFSRALCAGELQWAEVLGVEAERLHDAIDEASVAIGRQLKVGDGSPMTTWKTFSRIGPSERSAIAEYIATGGQGETDVKLIVVFGDIELFDKLVEEIESRQ